MTKESGERRAQTTAAHFSFAEDRLLSVFVCSHVAEKAPILFVSHDAGGDWQFLCGERHEESDDAKLVSLQQVVTADPSLNQLAKLEKGQNARRVKVGAEWSVRDPSEDFVQHAVAQFGLCIQSVDATEQEPFFSYTIGLQQTFDHPELIVFGLPHEAAQRLLNLVGGRIREGQRFEAGPTYEGLVDAHPVRLRPVLDTVSRDAHVGYALWYYGGSPFSLLQVLWPDANGVFPDGPLAPEWLQKAQPLLA